MERVEVGGTPVVVQRPSTPGPHPAVVVLHEASGLNRDIRRIVQRLADRGYVAAAPALYRDAGRSCIARTVRDALVPARRGTTDRIERVRRWLADADGVDGDRIGVIGFCMGGGFAVVAAARSPFGAAAVNYGRVPSDPQLLVGSCPVVANYGAQDRLVPGGTARRYEELLDAQGVPVDVAVFDGVGHSFMNHEPVVARLIGVAFDGPTAERAWERIERFFSTHLDPDASPADADPRADGR